MALATPSALYRSGRSGKNSTSTWSSSALFPMSAPIMASRPMMLSREAPISLSMSS